MLNVACPLDTRRTYHLKSPYPPNPHLQLAFDAPDVFKLNTFPPASTGRLSPEEQKLLGHTNGVAIGRVVAFNICAKPR
jgi:hypothetical protein